MAAKQRWFEKKGEAGKAAKERSEKRFQVTRRMNGKKVTQFYVGDSLPGTLRAEMDKGKAEVKAA